ncbi:MAG: phosphoribosylaminoimidazolesuccinocarboxamide synthase, partial [Bacteroidetes bacterium]|nr:phosphoribosylaminoimidazolesuccinocarboxamide synthase [Bacteroidota bacterium]
KYTGKVREVYDLDNGHIVMVATDRISAFDHILPEAIPHKGEVLNSIAAHFLKATQDIVPNWLVSVPHPAVAYGLKAEPIKLEMVIRGYCVGHAWRQYRSGKRVLCGEPMPEGMKENQAFPEPIITPATKAEEGHDEDISRAEILARGIVSEEVYNQLEAYTRALYKRGKEMAAERGLILVDTKYEFGMVGDKIVLIDEVHTPDSSRYFYADDYQNNLDLGLPQKHLSKEFVREWLISEGFQGLDGQQMPEMPEKRVQIIRERYFELYKQIMGSAFKPSNRENLLANIEQAVENAIAQTA